MPRSRPRFSRINSIIAIAALALVALRWGISLHLIDVERAETLRETYRQNSNLALAYEEHATRTLKAVDQVLLFVGDQYREHGQRLSIRRIVRGGALEPELFTHVSIEDERGDLKLGTGAKLPKLNFSGFDFFRAQEGPGGNGLFIGKPVFDRGAGKWAIPMSRRLSRPDGSFAGVVHAAVDPGYFIRFYREADIGKQGLVALVGLDGIVRARRTGEEGSLGEDLSTGNLLARQPREPAGTFRSEGRLDGVPRYFSYRTLQQYPLVVMVGSAESEALAGFRARERDYYLVAIGVTLMILALAGALLVVIFRQGRMIESVATSEARFRSLTKLSSDWYWEQDEQFRFTEIVGNSVAPREDVLGKPRWEVVLLSDADEAEHRRLCEAHRPFRDFVFRQLDREGRVHVVSSSGEPVFRDDGSFAGYRGTGRDITERVRTEEQLVNARIRLADAERLEAVGRLAASVAHEVKNPLAIMRLGVDYLLKHIPGDGAGAVVRDIRGAVERADTVIRGLLDFSRHKSIAPRPTRLAEVLDHALQLVRHEMTSRNIAVECRYSETPPVQADPGQLEQVFINLFTNAAQAIGHDGRIEIVLRAARLDEQDLQRDESGSFQRGDSAVLVEVLDSGPGIPPEHAERLFQPFFTTKDVGEGTGLGLAVSRNIVIMHGGSISIRNRPEGGASALVMFRSQEGQALDEKTHPGGR